MVRSGPGVMPFAGRRGRQGNAKLCRSRAEREEIRSSHRAPTIPINAGAASGGLSTIPTKARQITVPSKSCWGRGAPLNFAGNFDRILPFNLFSNGRPFPFHSELA